MIALRFFYARWECPVVAGNVLPCLVTQQSSAGADLEAKRLLLPGPHTIRREGAPPTERCASSALWEARPGAKLLLLPGPHSIRREGAPPTGGCTSACVGGPTRDEALAPARPHSIRREGAPPTGGDAHLPVWEARPRGEALTRPGPHTIRREGAPPTQRCARPAFVGGPPSGRSFYCLKPREAPRRAPT